MKLISIIWLIFTVLFTYLSYFHYEQSKNVYPDFKVIKRPVKMKTEILGMAPDKPLKDFAKHFNEYLDNQNKSNKKQNKLSAVGYIAAAFTSFISLLLTNKHAEKYIYNKYNLNPYKYLKNGIKRIWKKMNKDHRNGSD
ncbi:MAG TPA: hypothetical protein ENH52_15120 [Nitrospirae bacterium]|nr:hypothetical protein [Nitrospirota bacterium]